MSKCLTSIRYASDDADVDLTIEFFDLCANSSYGLVFAHGFSG